MTSHRLSFCYGLIVDLLLQGLILRYGPSPYDFSPGKEDGVCIWKSDVQVLTILVVNRT